MKVSEVRGKNCKCADIISKYRLYTYKYNLYLYKCKLCFYKYKLYLEKMNRKNCFYGSSDKIYRIGLMEDFFQPFSKYRMHCISCNFHQRFHNEISFCHKRVGDGKLIRLHDNVIVKENIYIDGTV